MEIHLPTDEEINQARRFRTYVNYLSALGNFIRETYPDPKAIVTTITTSPEFSRIQVSSTRDRGVIRRLLRNAWLTEIQIQLAAATEGLIPYSNHWAPVQLYYAVYLCTRAWFAACCRDIPTHHSSTLRTVAADIKSRPGLFPYPWKLLCEGDPEKNSLSYPFLPDGVKMYYVSSLRTDPSFWDSFGMFLRTTRQRQIKRSILDWKRSNRRKLIKTSERQSLVHRLPPTSLFDTLYRLRIRSNYADADAFLLSLENEAESIEFYKALRTICWHSMLVLETLIAAYISIFKYREIVDSFAQYDPGKYSEPTLAHRCEILERCFAS